MEGRRGVTVRVLLAISFNLMHHPLWNQKNVLYAYIRIDLVHCCIWWCLNKVISLADEQHVEGNTMPY